jgi:membrane-bound ClpP family serine protease
MDPLLLAIFLLIIALGLLVVDLFIPSGGVLIILTCLAALASVLVAFRISVETGLTFLMIVLGSVPGLLWLFVKVWPNTPIGKRMIGELPERSEVQWASLQQVQDGSSLIGRIGKTASEMIPAGLVDIDGKEFDALSEGQPIPAGATVRVLRLDMGRLVVAEYEVPSEPPPVDAGLATATQDELQRSIEDLGLESLGNN